MKNHIIIILGSKNDLPHLTEMLIFFQLLEITYKIKVISCHRNLKELTNFLSQIKSTDYALVLAVARSVANLPAVIAGYLKNKIMPVIGVGLSDKKLNGIDSLLSINTIPRDAPVLNTGIDEVGFSNAGLAIAILLAQKDKKIKNKLGKYLNK